LRPGTLARILVLSGLNRYAPVTRNQAARSALDRLVQRSQQGASANAVALVAKARGVGLPVKLVT